MSAKKSNSLLKAIRAGKKAGMTREQIKNLLMASSKDAARNGNWRDSELAMTLAEHERALDQVYGPESEEQP